MEFVVQERMAAIERGLAPWIELDNCGMPSTDPAAVESLNRILVAIGYDP